ncbi:MAG TPA: hypothetical protein PKY50_19825 [Candidatus Competibacter sp.]|nr:hypothetical protein [Candidatus Competibacter sp.]
MALNTLEDGGLLESAYREIDSETGSAAPVSAEAAAALLRRVAAPGPDGVAAAKRLARVSLDRWTVMPPENVD